MNEDADRRARFFQTANQMGMPAEESALLFDVTKHAYESALDSAIRIIETSPEGMRGIAMAGVCVTFARLLKDRFPETWAAFIEKHGR